MNWLGRPLQSIFQTRLICTRLPLQFRVHGHDRHLQRVIYEPGTYTSTQEEMGTRYIQMTVRTFVNPNDPQDIAERHKAQDGLKVTQANRGSFEVPNWDQAQLDGLRKAILTMTIWVPDSRYMFGRKDEVREVRLYRPRAEILNGSWNFPEAQPVR